MNDLNDGIAKDAAAATNIRDLSEPWDGQWVADGNHALRTYNGWVLATSGAEEFAPGLSAHVARHDPARVLREVAAKWQIVALCKTETDQTGGRPLATRILHLLASIYEDQS